MNPRLQKLRNILIEENLDAVFVSSLPNIIYFTNFSDFTTFDRDGFLLLTKKSQYIFTHGIYKEAVENQVKDFNIIDIKRENPISKAVKTIIQKEKVKKLGFENFDLKVNEYERLIKEVDKNILKPTNLVQKLRIQKTPDEILAIKKACILGDKAFAYIITQLKPGITELELAVAFEFFVKSHGATLSFESIVAFGQNASKPHHVPTNTKLKRNQFVLFDCGIKQENYCSDMTRTVFFGTSSKKQKKDYEAVLTSQSKAVALIEKNLIEKKQIKAKEIDAIARDYLTQRDYPSMPHSLGHGIGLEVHEFPRLTPLSDEILKTGNVFSIEPGMYIPGKFGIRIEDLYAIEENKLIKLTKAPNKFIEI
ncbi:MAG TPA: Xaa-Pro peptidase family protein [Candidatus Saccharimonadales bacterium]|nr:Xaa-Pro peptidase family protein [Candidatus Saccharimonadales bacterium]